MDAGPGLQPEGMQGILNGMMKVMQGMQVMQTQILDVKRQKDLEVVKSGVVELPKLQEWKADTAPLDLTDWFLSIEPAMGDLSDGSQQWWDGMLRAAKSWYSTHLEKTPLERVVHRPEAPPELKEMRHQRLEKRAAAVLMAAIPVSQQEEVIAGKEISTISILGKLMLSYQPGGLTEKAAILHALDSPEAQGLTQAVMGLRRWLRWHRRAGDVGVVRPDATIHVIGPLDEEGPQGQQRPCLQESACEEQPPDRHHPHGDHSHDLCAPPVGRGGAGCASRPPKEGREDRHSGAQGQAD